MLTAACKVTAVLLLATLVGVFVKRSSAAVRHMLWLSASFVALVLPLANYVLPTWTSLPFPQTLISPELEVAAATAPGVGATSDLSIASVAFFLWLAGFAVAAFYLAAGQFALARWKSKTSEVLSSEWRGIIDALARETSLPRQVQFREGNWLSTPCTWGVFRPIVLLPAAGAHWSEANRRCAVLHELAHIRRADSLTRTLSRLACAVHWYNPLMWMVARRAEAAQEEACDNAVLASHVLPSQYASLLVAVSRDVNGFRWQLSPALTLTRNSSTEKRVRAVLDSNVRRSAAGWRAILITSAFAIGALVVISTVAPAQKREQRAIPANEPTGQLIGTHTRAIYREIPDSVAIAGVAKQICEIKRRSGEHAETYTVRLKRPERTDSLPSPEVVYTFRISGCGRTPK